MAMKSQLERKQPVGMQRGLFKGEPAVCIGGADRNAVACSPKRSGSASTNATCALNYGVKRKLLSAIPEPPSRNS
jgi:hypothetical protein